MSVVPARARSGEDLSGYLVDGEHVVAVHLVAGEAVALGPPWLDPGQPGIRRYGDSVDVVLDKNTKGSRDAGQVHGLVPVALLVEASPP